MRSIFQLRTTYVVSALRVFASTHTAQSYKNLTVCLGQDLLATSSGSSRTSRPDPPPVRSLERRLLLGFFPEAELGLSRRGDSSPLLKTMAALRLGLGGVSMEMA